MITLITTFSAGGAANIGDLLIEESLRELLKSIGVDDKIFSVFREEPLEPVLDQINASRVVLLPGEFPAESGTPPRSLNATASARLSW